MIQKGESIQMHRNDPTQQASILSDVPCVLVIRGWTHTRKKIPHPYIKHTIYFIYIYVKYVYKLTDVKISFIVCNNIISSLKKITDVKITVYIWIL